MASSLIFHLKWQLQFSAKWIFMASLQHCFTHFEPGLRLSSPQQPHITVNVRFAAQWTQGSSMHFSVVFVPLYISICCGQMLVLVYVSIWSLGTMRLS